MTNRSNNSSGNTIMEAAPEDDNTDCSMHQTELTDITGDSSRASIRQSSKHFTHSGGSKSILMQYDAEVLKMVSQMDDHDSDEDDGEEGFCCRNYHIFCFCCCDIRRACIILNIVYVVLLIFLIVFVNMYEQMGVPTFEDDKFQEQIDGFGENTVLRSCIGIPVSIVGIFGAYRFHPWLVLLMSIWLFVYFVWAVLGNRYGSAIFALFLVFPELCLFLALRDGKITSDHYDKQKRCCCTKSKD